VTFKVTNEDAAGVTEAELVRGKAILGEKENLAPGLNGSFSLNVKAGKYQLYCPGGKGAERVDFTVTPAAAASASTNPVVDDALQKATSGYKTYVQGQADELVAATTPFVNAVKAGDIDKAASLYAAPRANYERIEPVAESFGDLDPQIDARIDDVENPADWTGFHRLEKAIFADKSLKGMSPIADKLLTDVKKLQTLTKTQSYQPAQIANGSTELLNEVGKTKVTGEEERYSHLDLVDIQANVDGAKEGFTLLQPALKVLNPSLESTVSSRFAAMDTALQPYKKGDSFVSYETVTTEQRRELSQSVDALAEPLSQVAGVVVG
jgi:iron uptake system component EfeO